MNLIDYIINFNFKFFFNFVWLCKFYLCIDKKINKCKFVIVVVFSVIKGKNIEKWK